MHARFDVFDSAGEKGYGLWEDVVVVGVGEVQGS